MDNDVYVMDPPPSECGFVEDDGLYIRGIGGGGWGGGEGGTMPRIIPIVPAAGDDTGVVTATTKRSTLRFIDADQVLAYAPETDWLLASSRDAWAKRSWGQFNADVFGMALAERLAHGIVEGMDVQDAVQLLNGLHLSETAWNNIGVYLNRISRVTTDNDGWHMVTLRGVSAWRRQQAVSTLARLHELLRKPHVAENARLRTYILSAMRIIAPQDALWMEDKLESHE